MPGLLALDFDGVICDSAGETARAGWLAARRVWPDLPEFSDSAIGDFPKVRPVLHTGWQSVILLRLLYEGVSVARILEDVDGQLSAACMRDHGLEQDALKQAFGASRDAWIRRDEDGWLAAHTSYDGVVEAIQAYRNGGGEAVIITTKQRRFAKLLLDRFGVVFADNQIFDLEDGPKARVLGKLLEAGDGREIIFVEDRLATLLVPGILNDARIQKWLADWGYLTDADRRLADESPSLQRIGLTEFCERVAGLMING